MKNVWLIIRRELAAYARTPSGYIIGAAYLLVSGLLFNARALGSTPRLSSDVLQQFFIDTGFTTGIAAIFFAMRMLAEERSTGTDVLLFTSPLRESEVVLAKFLSALAFLTILIVSSLYLPALIFVNGKVSLGHIAAGYLGMFLLGACTLAVGVFASTLVRHPFLAVLIAFVLMALLELSWAIAQVADPPLSDLLAYFAPYMKHFHPFRRGLLQLNDIVFYASIIYLSLFGATRVLQSQRWR